MRGDPPDQRDTCPSGWRAGMRLVRDRYRGIYPAGPRRRRPHVHARGTVPNPRTAFDGSAIPWTACFREDRGDGALVVVPPSITATGVIDPLPERLASLVRRHNHVSCAAAHIQLRAAAHLGPVDHDGHGFVGIDVDFLFRMLDARALRRTLINTRADLALIVSEYVYRNVVCRHPSLISPAAFRLIRFQVKGTRARAWTYLPSAPSWLTATSARAC
jgi:hypothetical protein